MNASADYVYVETFLPGRGSVREPIPAPVMRFIALDAPDVLVRLNEAQLLCVLRDVTETLERLRQCRHATVPDVRDEGPGS